LKRADPIARPQLGGKEADEFGRRVAERLNAVTSNPLMRGRLLTASLRANGDEFRVAHGLGRRPLGWIPVGNGFTGYDFYNSGQQTITAGGQLTLEHGLGAAPLQLEYRLVCTTGEFGFTAGDIIDPTPSANTSSALNTSRGLVATLTDTKIVIRFSNTAGSAFSVPRADTGAAASLTDANWVLVVYAQRRRDLLEVSRDESFIIFTCPGAVSGDRVDLLVF
jgi:hypothetical protein